MTPTDSKIRLVIYVLIAMVTTASAGVITVDFGNRVQVTAFALAIVLSGLNTARSYIDKTPADVIRKDPD